MANPRQTTKKRKGRPPLPKAERKDAILDLAFTPGDMKLLHMAADLEALKVRTWGARVLLLAARERIRIESGLDSARPKPTKS
jgi:hypothetical protein